MQRLYYHLLFSLLITLGALWVVISKPVNFGLDLKGGIEVILYPEIDKALKLQYEKYAESIVWKKTALRYWITKFPPKE